MSDVRELDDFAKAALTGLVAGVRENLVFHAGVMANEAYDLAEAMIVERDKRRAKMVQKDLERIVAKREEQSGE